ncbi:hypothetical protein ACFYWN_37595 [Streptomyces sp. NPDC002917]|uniref:hypothetical protein n=1 Tax=Streptomyces sp. NPDC002917 TaxID=3364671 RepID=UPI00368A6873
MHAPSLEPTARLRKSRTRTKKVSARPELVVSTLRPHQFDLRPVCISLVCPDCMTWCPITGTQSSTPKLVPHHTEGAGAPKGRRCIGSNRLLRIDLTVDEWQQRLAGAIADTASRRATTVLRKPNTPSAPAASQVQRPPLSAEMIRRVFRAHQTQCGACKGEATDRNGEPLPCPDGERLAVTYLRLVRQEPKRAKVREFVSRERARFDRNYAAQMSRQRAAEWGKYGVTAVERAALAKQSGTAVEEANNQRQFAAMGAVSEFRGPDVPLAPIHLTR